MLVDQVRTEKKNVELNFIFSRGIHYPIYHCICFLNITKTSVYATIVKIKKIKKLLSLSFINFDIKINL